MEKICYCNKSSNFNNIAVFTDGVQDALMQKVEGKWEINRDGFNFLFPGQNIKQMRKNLSRDRAGITE